ncbi:MAG: NgoMIV family type II restriction endonuclease [Candidatus Rifleibacteriota bacterium]
MKPFIRKLREDFHKEAFNDLIRIDGDNLNFADTSSRLSKLFAASIVHEIGLKAINGKMPGQTAGQLFENKVKEFLEKAFGKLNHLRPGRWGYENGASITTFEQYSHLTALQIAAASNPELAVILGGDYIIKPDIVIYRSPETDEVINKPLKLIDKDTATFTPLRASANRKKILHASISCKWTIRSDRSQNSRTEALNLIRNRKGNLPHIMVVTAEPLPSRLASIALGTGDIDCVYHFALPELQKAVNDSEQEDSIEILNTMVEGRRLRDITDLPFDLAI